MSIYNEVLDLQEENDDLRKSLRDIRTTVNEVLSDLQFAGKLNVVDALNESVDGLNRIISKIDATL